MLTYDLLGLSAHSVWNPLYLAKAEVELATVCCVQTAGLSCLRLPI